MSFNDVSLSFDLSDVAEYVTWLNSLYDPTEPLATAKNETEDYAAKLNDMRAIIRDTMETLFDYDGLYKRINETHIDTKNQCARIRMLHDKTNQSIAEGEDLIDEARGLLLDAKNNIQVLARKKKNNNNDNVRNGCRGQTGQWIKEGSK